MDIQKTILNIVLTIESFFISFLKIKSKRITFISLESDILSSDFKLIYNSLDKDELDIKLCLIHYHKNLWGQFLYFINCMKQLYLINTSHIVLLHDNNYVVSHFKRKGVIIIQTWHACGAIKKFGNVIEREYPIANYDYALATSSYWQQPYSQAFDILPEHVLPIGLPRTDELFNQNWIHDSQEYLYHKYPFLKNKKIILYAPTFRGNIYKGFKAIPFDAIEILKQLDNDYVILYKFHPLMGNYQLTNDDSIFNMNQEDIHVLFSITDYLISDYSSVIFDYMILEKPLIFFVPDLEEYSQELGVFVDLNQLQCPICYKEDEVTHIIKTNNWEKSHIQELKNIYFDYQDGKSTQRVIDFIRGKINEEM